MDLTEQKQMNANFEGQLNALSRVMGKVEFSLMASSSMPMPASWRQWAISWKS